jgi:hypothetical protein
VVASTVVASTVVASTVVASTVLVGWRAAVFVTTGLVTTGLMGGPVTGVRRGAARRSRTALHLPWHLLGLLRPPVPPRKYSSKLVGFVKKSPLTN